MEVQKIFGEKKKQIADRQYYADVVGMGFSLHLPPTTAIF